MGPIDEVRSYLERRTAVTLLATADRGGNADVCLLVAPRLTPEGHLAGGEEETVAGQTFRNLRQNPAATLLVLDPIVDPRSRDGLRIRVEFLGAEEDGEELQNLTDWLSTFAPGRRMARRLLFKILEVAPYRPPGDTPVIQG